MSADSITISRDLVNAGLEQKIADAIAQTVVANAASEAVARVEAKVDAERETKSDRLDRIEDRLDRMEDRLDKMDIRLTRLETKTSMLMWMLGALIGLNIAMFVFLLNTPTA